MRKKENPRRERGLFVFLLLFALIFLRYCYFGLQYFPQLDDYIQMHNQSAYYTAKQVILDMGLLSSRPLASVGDYFVWSRFWGQMMLVVAFLSALYAGSAVLFREVWRKYFGTGYVFLTVYALLPLGMEGAYWVSASSRILPSLFLTALAMRLFQRWCQEGRRSVLALYLVTQLLSYCFYEQGLVLSVTGVLLVGILEFKTERRRSLFALLTFMNAGIYFAFTGYFSSAAGQLGSRMKLTLPWQAGWDAVFESAFTQTGGAYALGGWKTAVRGFRRGAELIFSAPNPLWGLLLLGLCALLFLAARRHTTETARTPAALLVGFLMALAPVTLFFILAQPAVALRNTVFSFCGLALMVDSLFGLAFRRASFRGTVAGGVCAALALVFCVAAVSELADYRQTYRNDQTAGAAVRAVLDEGRAVPLGGRVAVLGLEGNYLPEQNFEFHEHIHGATESVWAFTGLLACESGNRDFPYTTPIPSAEGADLSGYAAVLVYDRARGTASYYEP